MFITLGELEIAPGFPFKIKVKYENKEETFYLYYFEKDKPGILFRLGDISWDRVKQDPKNFEYAVKAAIHKLLQEHTYEVKKYLDKSINL